MLNILSDIEATYVTAKMFSKSTGGFLMLDSKYNILGFSEDYTRFHKRFNNAEIKVGRIFSNNYFDSYPERWITGLRNVLEENVESHTLKIEILDDAASSFQVTMAQCSFAGKRSGACIMIENIGDPMMHSTIQNDDLFRELIDNSTVAYLLADSAMVFTYASKGIQQTLGFSPVEIVGQNAIELVHSEDKKRVKDWLINLRTQHNKPFILEYRMLNSKGEFVWVENTAKNMMGNESVGAIVMNIRNIQSKKIADNTLIQAEQRLSLLLNNTEESFIILNSRLRIITYNKAAQERSPFAYTHHLQSGLSVLDLVKKEEIHDYINLFEEVFKGKQLEKETTLTDRDNNVRYYNHTFRPLTNAQLDINGVVITSMEITERKKLAEEVTAHSERLKTAQQVARLGYLEYDIASKKFFCSELFSEVLGLGDCAEELDELKGMVKFIHPDDREYFRSEIKSCIKTGKEFSIEFRFEAEGTKEKVILAMGDAEKNEKGTPVKLRFTMQDITDSKMALLAIQTLESQYKSLFEHSIDGIILSKDDGEIFSANTAACAMLGYTLEELTSLSRSDLVDINSEQAVTMLDTRERTGVYSGEIAYRHKKGFFVPAEITSVYMSNMDGSGYFSTIIRNITEKKKTEEEQKALTEELVKNNQDLQQFSFITSHNLRSPVANLISLLNLYNKENPADEFNQTIIEKFEEATTQLNLTLNDLINILVIKSSTNVEKEDISLTHIFERVEKNIGNLLEERKGTIITDFSKADELQYNRIHIESLFLNMLTNAIRYSSPERAPEIKIRSYKAHNFVVVEFADNGLGMDLKRYGDRLFGLYQRFHGNKDSKGLGLYMTHSQVKAMGGKIEVESEPGKGTTFKVFFKQ